MNTIFQKLCIPVALILGQFAFAQAQVPLGPNSRLNKFTYDIEASDSLYGHRYAPLKRTVTAYTEWGEKLVLKPGDVIVAKKVYFGEWRKKKGKWIFFYQGNYAWYVPLIQLKSVEKEQAKIEQEIALRDKENKEAYDAHVREKLLKLAYKVGIGLAIFAVIMLLTKSWRRENSEGIFALGTMLVSVGSGAMLFTMIPIFGMFGAMFILAVPFGTVVVWFSAESFRLKFLWSIPFVVGIALLVYLDLLKLRHII